MSTHQGRLFAGIDWATKTHAVCVVDDQGAIKVRFEIPNTNKTFTGLVKRLSKLDVEGVAIERCDGPLVEAFLDAGLRVVVITPRQVKGLRSRYTGSGAKSDAGDAYLLADVLRTDGHRLTPLTQDSEATQVLRSLSRTRKQLVESRVGLVNQLHAQLERCFPAAIGLFSRLDSDVTIAFLRRYPTQHAASRLTPARFAAFLRRIAYCGRKPVDELYARIADAPSAGLSATEAEGRAVCVLALLRTIETTRHEERELEAEIIERLDAHADAHIFTSLPKAGHGVRAALLLSEIGDVRARFPDEESLAALAGVAPVTKASGKLHTVGFRWAADKKLRNALIDFADDSRNASPWAAKIYADAIARGKRHPHAVRILARAWVRVIWRCWQDHTAYNPELHGGAMQLQAA
ncbi:IS110 family transposase [Nocardioides sp. QY071]|uniref:IS110 family transposase n=1 Tax=Nocardioides sp. QY071 TaxID=3044187 RepID=UPI00249B34E3|nr:IS110 family transposase [Nocardioides sp. QY071]WGX99609.1 IS110 family transposase [Nocardioides sp. QY071]WGY01574.1 IS110 family transposase [Nocardioides sp. QY071]WGY02639.1 IS110 family transposase [Nocardioides sp. QY071]WGY04698.1 IS110 family transposase [Nocardioides sp. QY071]